jgi:hypothetical protein
MFEVYKSGFLGSATLLGAAVVPVARFLLHGAFNEWIAVVDTKHHLVAELDVVLNIQRTASVAAAAPPVVVVLSSKDAKAAASVGVARAADANELYMSAIGDGDAGDALAESTAFYDGDWKTVSGNWKEFSVDQLKFEGVGEPTGARISGGPAFLQLLQHEMEVCKKWGLIIGCDSTAESVVVHMAIDVSDMSSRSADACGIDKQLPLVVRFEWKEPTHYMGACPSPARKTLEVRQSSDSMSKLDGRAHLASWLQFGLWWTLEQRIAEHLQAGWQRFSGAANQIAELVKKEVELLTPQVRDILDMFEWPFTDRPLVERALALAGGNADEALNILFDDVRERELRAELGLLPARKPVSAHEGVPDVDALAFGIVVPEVSAVVESVAVEPAVATTAASTVTEPPQSAPPTAQSASPTAQSAPPAVTAAPTAQVVAPTTTVPTTSVVAPAATVTVAATAAKSAAKTANADVVAAKAKKLTIEKADSIYWTTVEFVKSTLVDIAKRCLICNAPHPLELQKPTICSNQLCSFQFTSFGLGVDVEREIVRSPEIVDLLICFTAAGTLQPERFSPFPDVQRRVAGHEMSFSQNHNAVDLREALCKLPSVKEMGELATSAPGALRAKLDAAHPLLYLALRWIVSTTLAHFDRLTDKTVPQRWSRLGEHQFIMRCAPPAREAQFRDHCRKHGGSFFVWHGSGLGNWHNIVRSGLKNMSGTAYQSSGAAYGPGIYSAQDSATSYGYSGNTSQPWANTIYGQGARTLALCEVVDHGTRMLCLGKVHRPGCLHSPSSPYFRIEDEEFIVTRFFVVFMAHEGAATVDATEAHSYFSKHL